LLEQAETHGLPEGFRLPEPVMLTAADGVTPIQALVARPSDFDPNKKYPIIDYVYGGPQVAIVPTSFDIFAIQAQQFAELGFIAVMVDGRGTAGRDRAFHEASYGAAQTASNLEDHIAGIRQLAARFPYIDLDRVGVNGFSGGGYMAASAMMRFPDFFKVGVAESGNHDQRTFWYSWGERYQGLLDDDNYLAQANMTYAGQLKGKLLLIHGLMDMAVHPSNLFQLTQKLMDANKDFDLIVLPRARHEPSGYSVRRRWDYFVTNLLAQEPPRDFKVTTDAEYAQQEAMRRAGSEEKPN
jgi:dipeptidyl aminopeptidase/acylaminoacyl peptidase